MNRTKMIVAAAVFGSAVALADCVPGIAAGARDDPAPAAGILQALAGSALSNQELSTARGGTDLNITRVTNSDTSTLNVDAASSGTVIGGGVLGGATGTASGGIIDSQGIISQLSNTGNNVMMNSSVAIFINAQ
ncbi:MAG: hypothetical protein ACREFJ_20715 [Acetobacteraceae bacterium]